jgi:hypothetical protein
LPEIGLRADRIHLTGALNQIPTELLFQDGMLVGQRLGPLSYADLRSWLASHPPPPHLPNSWGPH